MDVDANLVITELLSRLSEAEYSVAVLRAQIRQYEIAANDRTVGCNREDPSVDVAG